MLTAVGLGENASGAAIRSSRSPGGSVATRTPVAALVADVTLGRYRLTMANITDGKWPTTAARTRLVTTRLWDGRCGHCGTQLISNEFSRKPPVIEVDHFVPRSHAGIDHPGNYVAACHDCNHARSNDPVRDPNVIAHMTEIADFVHSDGFEDFVCQSMELDQAINDGALMVAVRCVEHGWHLEDSPQAVRCFEESTRALPLEYQNDEWWSRFGQRSAEVLAAVNEHLHAADLNSQEHFHIWGGLHLDLPRYSTSPDTAASTLDAMIRHGRDTLQPAPSWFVYGRLPLGASNDSRARSRSLTLDVATAFEFWKDHGVTSKELLRFWMQNHCPTHLLADYPDAVRLIHRTGVRKHIKALSKYVALPRWDRSRAFELYLAERSRTRFR